MNTQKFSIDVGQNSQYFRGAADIYTIIIHDTMFLGGGYYFYYVKYYA